MLVIKLERAPPRVRGFCSSWALQIAPGVYVANLPARQRDEIWSTIERWADWETRAIIVWSSPRTEQGLDYRVIGDPRRTITGREGLLVSAWLPEHDFTEYAE